MSSRADLRRFYALDLDFSALGLAPWSENDGSYFCTPANAEPFASAGVDGVHYCLLPDGEAVYVVRPECFEAGRYVLPVAEDFRQFLSFLLLCGSEAPVEQLADWTEEQFRACLREEALPEQNHVALSQIAEAFQAVPEDPFPIVKALQARFDPAGLLFSDAYYDCLGLENPREESWSAGTM